MARVRPGGWGWVGLATYVATFDAWLVRRHKPSMSEVFGDALKHPVKRWPTMIAWFIITIHLFAELLPRGLRTHFRRFDPLGLLAHAIEGAAPGGD